ncbi:MAG TPA: hypothetical protein PL143_20695 [Rhodocyclaceae bacterium]|nr:hypothetical protein [Rhodocyclaceae bacterium]
MLLWNSPDDPTGELRWCLSKMRGVLDEPGRRRVVADGDGVALDLSDRFVDALEVGRAARDGIDRLEPQRSRTLAALFADDLFEGLEIDRSPDFAGWLGAQRSRLRACRTPYGGILRHDSDRARTRPSGARPVPAARALRLPHPRAAARCARAARRPARNRATRTPASTVPRSGIAAPTGSFGGSKLALCILASYSLALGNQSINAGEYHNHPNRGKCFTLGKDCYQGYDAPCGGHRQQHMLGRVPYDTVVTKIVGNQLEI